MFLRYLLHLSCFASSVGGAKTLSRQARNSPRATRCSPTEPLLPISSFHHPLSAHHLGRIYTTCVPSHGARLDEWSANLTWNECDAITTTGLHPCPPFLYRGGASSTRRTVRQPGYLLSVKRPLGFAPPPHDGFALLACAHGCTWLQAHSPCLLQIHHTLNPSLTPYPVADAIGELRCLRVASCHSLLPALIAVGDGSAMNFEAVGVLFRHFLLIPAPFCALGVNFAENVALPSVGTYAATGRGE